MATRSLFILPLILLFGLERLFALRRFVNQRRFTVDFYKNGLAWTQSGTKGALTWSEISEVEITGGFEVSKFSNDFWRSLRRLSWKDKKKKFEVDGARDSVVRAALLLSDNCSTIRWLQAVDIPDGLAGWRESVYSTPPHQYRHLYGELSVVPYFKEDCKEFSEDTNDSGLLLQLSLEDKIGRHLLRDDAKIKDLFSNTLNELVADGYLRSTSSTDIFCLPKTAVCVILNRMLTKLNLS